MARKKLAEGEINRSQAIRDLLKENPKIKASDAVSALAEKGVKIKTSLFYIVKGKALGKRSRRRKNQRKAVEVATAPSSNGSVTSNSHRRVPNNAPTRSTTSCASVSVIRPPPNGGASLPLAYASSVSAS